MTDYEQRRLTMVESQLRPNDVTDPRLLSAMRALPRERFVPAPLRELAYIDESLGVFPSIDGAPPRYLLAPMVLARLVQLMEIQPSDKLLDVGCATGYSTAVLARLARFVTGLEPEPELAEAARRSLQSLGIANVEIVAGPLACGYEAGAPYDAILLNGSVPAVPEALLSQLRVGGRLAAVVKSGGAASQGKASLFVKVGSEGSGRAQFDAGANPLPGFAPEPCFTL